MKQNLCEIINLKGGKCVQNDYNNYNNYNIINNIRDYQPPFEKRKTFVCRYNIGNTNIKFSFKQVFDLYLIFCRRERERERESMVVINILHTKSGGYDGY